MTQGYRGKGIVVYARSSIAPQNGDESSVDRQVGAAKSWIAKHGATHVATFKDEGTGTNPNGRPGFQAMMAMVRAAGDETGGSVDAIFIEAPSRLARDQLEFVNLMADLKRRNVCIVSGL